MFESGVQREKVVDNQLNPSVTTKRQLSYKWLQVISDPPVLWLTLERALQELLILSAQIGLIDFSVEDIM